MQKFEYHVATLPHPEVDRDFEAHNRAQNAALNALGAQGWELVGFGPHRSDHRVFYFKRVVAAETAPAAS